MFCLQVVHLPCFVTSRANLGHDSRAPFVEPKRLTSSSSLLPDSHYYQPVVKVNFAKNRVQPANSLRAESFCFEDHDASELVAVLAVLIFRTRTTFATGYFARVSRKHFIYPNPAFLVDRAAGRL